MSDTILSPNMNLGIPIVSVDQGPQWATDLNACLSVIDQHDHSSGNGVQITSAGINITADLPLNGNNLTTIRSARFSSQASALVLGTDLNCSYVINGDFYYNNSSGTAVQITNGGSIAGATGSITGLSSPASASYVSGTQTFVWQSDASTPANLDAGSIILRNITASSKGITVSAATALAADYTVMFPGALPSAQKFMTLDASGNIAAAWVTDNSTLNISGNNVQIKNGGVGSTQIATGAVGTTQLADGGVTRPKLAALGQVVSSSSGSVTVGTSITTICTAAALTTTGRPVFLSFISDGSGNGSTFGITASRSLDVSFYRGGTLLAVYSFTNVNSNTINFAQPIFMIDTPSAGTYTYIIKAQSSSNLTSPSINYFLLMAYEL